MGGGIHGEDALLRLSHTATVCVAGFFIDPNPNRFVGPKFFHCMLPSPLCGIFAIDLANIRQISGIYHLWQVI